MGFSKSIANFLFYVCYMIPFGLIIDEKSKVTVVKGDGEPDKRITVRKTVINAIICPHYH